MYPKVLQLTLNYNRFTLMRRSLKSFIDQDYQGPHTLLIWNTGAPLELGELHLPENKKVIVVNSNKEYSCVGDKYNTAIEYLNDYEVINMLDSDDFALPHNITNGVLGYQKAQNENKLAYKPLYNYFLNGSSCSLSSNVHEGSIFVNYEHVYKRKFFENSVKYHDKWLLPLIEENKILVDSEGKPGWVYTWGENIPTYKMSGKEDSKGNYLSSQQLQNDTGNGQKLIPLSDSQIKDYYNLIKVQ